MHNYTVVQLTLIMQKRAFRGALSKCRSMRETAGPLGVRRCWPSAAPAAKGTGCCHRMLVIHSSYITVATLSASSG